MLLPHVQLVVQLGDDQASAPAEVALGLEDVAIPAYAICSRVVYDMI